MLVRGLSDGTEQLKKFRFFTMELKLPDGADPKIFEGAVGEEPDGQLVLP